MSVERKIIYPADSGHDPDALESGDDGGARDQRRKTRRKPRKMTAERLHRIALAYLDRYDASEAHFRGVLERRVVKAARAHDQDPADFAEMINAQVAKMVEAGFINNTRYAGQQVNTLRGRGGSTRMITARLRAKGVEDDAISSALNEAEGNDTLAAERYARRRRLGPYRLNGRAERRDRDLAALCRAGFDYGLAVSIVDRDTGAISDGPTNGLSGNG